MEFLAEAPPNEDFFERFEIDRLVSELPEHARVPTMVGYFNGWRLDAVLSRRLSEVDEEFLTLDEAHAKNKKPILFPIKEGESFPELKPLLKQQMAYVRELSIKLGKVIPWLFPNPRTGEQLKTFYDSWNDALERAGLNVNPVTQQRRVHSITGEPVTRTFHSLRRTATGKLEALGLSELATMELVGHKTRSMHLRYRGMADKARVRRHGTAIAAGVTAQEPSNIRNFVQPASNGAGGGE